jgi:adenylosuccinate synthase
MPLMGLIGCQWGDEGKGKLVDIIAAEADIVARYQGGNNAGHTVLIGKKTHILHSVPSGILNPDTDCLIGNGVVLDPISLVEEIESLESADFNVRERLYISENTHLIMPYHKLIDQAMEKFRGSGKIGTTGRGVGCAYADKYSRHGLRACDLRNYDRFRNKCLQNCDWLHPIFDSVFKTPLPDFDKCVDSMWESAEVLQPMIIDGVTMINDALTAGKKVLAEGAQGLMLDIDFGTFPYVTSSNPSSGGICTGLGVPPSAVEGLIGVAKVYCTRVGEGPFPSEQLGEVGDQLRELGKEFGATTGRPRRCGWFDVPAMRRALQVTGIKSLALTKADVLDTFESFPVCVAYELDGRKIDMFPLDTIELERVKPIFDEVPGWMCSTNGCRNFEDLPPQLLSYVKYLEDLLQVSVTVVSTGAERSRYVSRTKEFFPG